MLGMVNDSIYNDEQLCQTELLKRHRIISPLQKEKENNFRIYPNPANNLINIEWDQKSDGLEMLVLFNPIDQEVFTRIFSLNANSLQVTLHSLRPGEYKCCLINSLGKRDCHKIILVR